MKTIQLRLLLCQVYPLLYNQYHPNSLNLLEP